MSDKSAETDSVIEIQEKKKLPAKADMPEDDLVDKDMENEENSEEQVQLKVKKSKTVVKKVTEKKAPVQ